MRWKKHSAEEIVQILDGVSNTLQTGVPVKEAILQAGVSAATYFRWRARYGRLDADHLGVIKRLEAENARLRRALAALENEDVA